MKHMFMGMIGVVYLHFYSVLMSILEQDIVNAVSNVHTLEKLQLSI